MTTIYKNVDLQQFDAWSGAIETKETIINSGKTEEFNELINDSYPDGIDKTHLNDLLWFDTDYLYDMLGIEAN